MGGNESVEVTAGIWGFLVLFGLALACWFLFRSMNAHIRRVNFTERQTGRSAPLDGTPSTRPSGREDDAAARRTEPRDEADSRASVLERPDDPIGGPGH